MTRPFGDWVSGDVSFNYGGKATFLAKFRNRAFSAGFESGDGEGFEIVGTLVQDRGQGEWRSPTLSCSGEWRAERARQ